MKNKKLIILPILIGYLCCFSACSDGFTTGEVDAQRYATNEQTDAYLNNAEGVNKDIVDLYNAEDASVTLNVQLTKPVSAPTEYTIKVDESLVEGYNREHSSDFKAFPSTQVTFANDGKVTIGDGKQASEPVQITLTSSQDLETGKSYILPVVITSASNGIGMAESRKVYYYIIRAQGDRLNPQKDPDVKVMSCFGIDNENPLIHTQFFLKKSGKPLFDIVVLFSAGINYNAETKQVYVYKNGNLTYLLNNRDKYIKPLQDMGIKVVLGLCGNRDFTGCGTLLPETSKQFARELKNVCDSYGLDGVYFDDEYTTPGTDLPGFSQRGTSNNASYLCYETKKIMPDKLVTVFLWASMSYLQTIEGKKPGEYADYFMPNYYSEGYMSGAEKRQIGARSSEMTGYQWYAKNFGDLNVINQKGYGLVAVFGMGPYQEERKSGSWLPWSTQKHVLDIIAHDVFDDEVEVRGDLIRRDW